MNQAVKSGRKQQIWQRWGPNCHKATLTYDVALPSCGNTAEILNKNERKTEENRHSLIIVLEALRLFARRGLSIRGLIY